MRFLGTLLLLAALASLTTCGGEEKLQGCASCSCNCGSRRIDVKVQGLAICDCDLRCTSDCGGPPVSATCVGGRVEVNECAN